ncbi:hypothetical protein [Rhizobacter sp. Root1221]|nr:hypothetical protein [Rhizobacter sp. Root1221]
MNDCLHCEGMPDSEDCACDGVEPADFFSDEPLACGYDGDTSACESCQ